jgi:DNA-binding response OmpR family regulator
MQLLIVEDERAVADTLRESLSGYGFRPECAYSADQAWEALWQQAFDLIILDIMLPEGEEAGFRLAGQMRDAGFRQPILFLTARDGLPDLVRGLEHGDDYLAKPFALIELVARLKALYRRGESRPREVAWHDLVLYPEERLVRQHGDQLRLTGKEFDILELFLLNPGRLFSREDVLERVWGPDFESPSNLIDVYVNKLRSKLGGAVIDTVRGVGYRFPG